MGNYKKTRLAVLGIFLSAIFIVFFNGLGLNEKSTHLVNGLIIKNYNWSSIFFLFLFTVIAFVIIGFYIVKYMRESPVSFRDEISDFHKCILNKYIKYPTIFIGVLIIALGQVYTIWDFGGEEVDENAIFHFAVGFFGGDFDPVFTAYGPFGMYLSYAVYLILYIPFYLTGRVSSIEEYGMQLFYNNYFLLVTRYVFAVLGIVAVIFYTKLFKQIGIPIILTLIFFTAAIIHYDAIFFANFIRTDQLVMMFSAASIYFAVNSHKKSNLLFLAISVAGAIASKVSAIPLIGLLGLYVLYRLYDKSINWKYIFWIGIVFFGALLLFQPYNNVFTKVFQIFETGLKGYEGGEHRNFYWAYQETVLGRLLSIYKYFVIYVSKPILFSLVLLPFAVRYLKVLVPALITLFLLTVPYLTALTLKYYWFLPAYSLVKFLSFLGFYAFILFVVERLASKITLIKKNKKWLVSTVVSLIIGFFIIIPNLNSYLANYKWILTNQKMAKNYLIENYLETEPVVLDGLRHQYLPKIYSLNNIYDSRKISRTFMHHRASNEYLSAIFEDYLQNNYLTQIGLDSIRNIRQFRYTPENGLDYIQSLNGKYFVTSPFIYEKPIRNLSQTELGVFYTFITSNTLVKRFDDGRGQSVEIYHITKTYEGYQRELGL